MDWVMRSLNGFNFFMPRKRVAGFDSAACIKRLCYETDGWVVIRG